MEFRLGSKTFPHEWYFISSKNAQFSGPLMKLLKKTGISEDITWKATGSTYIYQFKQDGYFSKGGSKISKVPCNDKEALKSDFLGLLEKNRCRNFLAFLQKYDPSDLATHSSKLQNQLFLIFCQILTLHMKTFLV